MSKTSSVLLLLLHNSYFVLPSLSIVDVYSGGDSWPQLVVVEYNRSNSRGLDPFSVFRTGF